MADDKPRPPQRAWRDAVNPTGHAAKGGPAWKGGVDDTKGGKQPWSKNARLALAACLFGGVVAVTVIVILWLWPLKPPLLVVLSAGYETNLAIPQNAPGRAAAREFAEWGRGEGKENFKGVEQGDLTSNLESLRKTLAASRAKTVVLFLAAHGSADEEGVYLVPQDADIKDRAKSRVRLDQILTLLGEELPSGSKKLLILDATQVTASWTLGLFHNDFARQLKGLEDRIKAIPGLVVIAASGEDQRSWVSEEWRQSVFAHHVLQGLRGAAGKGGRGITAQDLFDYVKAKVTHWARHNRGSLQTPLLLGKEQVAREMELVVASGTPPPDNFKKAPVLPPDLARAWTDHDKLAAQTPPPATYTPHRWRRYQDSLVRYEQLLRAGDDASAKVLLDSLTLLHQKIFAARALKIDSALGSLAMPAALGWDLPPVDEAKLSELKALLEKKNKQDAKKNYAEWLGTEKEQWKKRLLRVRLGGELLALAAEDPGRYLEPLRDLLAAPEDIDAPRPAEVQYLALLTHKDELAPQLPQPSWDLVKEALLLRRLAEEAAVGLAEGEARGRQPIPYSEAVLPWIRENLDNADRERRLGQDLLLASKDTDLKEAVERLGKARTLYREIQTVAPRVRAAMLVRDRALADLPYYSQWVAGRRFIGRAQLKKYREPIDSQLELWQAVNALDRQLQQPGVIGPELDKLTGAVKTGLKKIQDEVADLSKQEFAAHQEKWHEIEGLLSTPFIPAKRRLALLGRLREISEKLSQVEADKGGGDVGMTAPDAQLLARESARAQGQLALSALGEEVFKASKGRSDFGQMRQAIWDAPEDVWQKPLANAAEELAHRWNRIPDGADDRVTKSRREPIDKAAVPVREAAMLTRRLPGAIAAWLTTDPIEEQRRLQMYDLLCQQGERTFQDFLAADAPERNAEPYYWLAGMVYHNDALDQMKPLAAEKQSAERLARAARLKDDLSAKPPLAVVWSQNGHKFQPVSNQPLNLTDEPQLRLWYGVKGKVPDGYPVLWRERNDKASFLKPPAATGRWVQRGVGPDPGKAAAEYPVVREPDQEKAGEQVANQVVQARFRGHVLNAETKLSYFGQPDYASSLPTLPKVGKLTVMGDAKVLWRFGQGNGAIVFVLDCSGSMNDPANPNLPKGAKPTRFDVARRELKEVLKQVPTGTRVSIWVFSQAYDVTVTPARNLTALDSEDTIQRLYPPRQSPPRRWDRKLLAEVESLLDALTAYSDTPLVRSMVEASADFKGATGFKTLVVLTDGMDNRFKGKIPEYLHDKFGNSDIAVRIIGFQLPKGEAKAAKEQFEEPLKKLGERWRFHLVDKTPELIKALRESIRQQLFFHLQHHDFALVEKDASGVDIRRGVDIHPMERSDTSPVELPPDTYWIDISAIHPPLSQKIHIKRGEGLRLNLLPLDGGGFVLQRELIEKAIVGGDTFPGEDTKTKDWRVTIRENQMGNTADDPLLLKVSVEYLKSRVRKAKDDAVSQVNPSLVMFQVKPQERLEKMLALRYRPVADFVAPSWQLETKPWWPKSRKVAPMLDAFWWSEDGPRLPNAYVIKIDAGLSVPVDAAEFKALMNPATEEEGTVRLLSLGMEKHKVDTYNGGQEPQECLVVRLEYPKDRPVMVQLPTEGFPAIGQEHRFYSKANKYTGIFWGPTKQWLEDNLRTLRVISVEGFRQAAIRAERHMSMKLDPP